jgi:phosphatidylserine synthase
MHYIKLKDLFTLLNLFVSLLAALLLFEDKFELASYLLVFSIFILDLLDGFVARLTRSQNTFGKHLDTVTDFVGSSIMIPFFIYHVYKPFNPYLACILAFSPLVFGVLRDVQSKMESVNHGGFFIGLPRIMSALFILGYLNSNFITQHKAYIPGAFLIVLVGLMQLTHWPYLGNDKRTVSLKKKIKIYLAIALALQVGLTAMGLFWDGLTIFLFAYIIQPPVTADKGVWENIRRQLIKNKSDSKAS